MSRYHYDIRVALHLKTGQIAGPEPYRDLCGRRLPRLHGKAKTPVEGGIQAAVIPRLDLVHFDPHRIDAVGITRLDRSGNGILRSGGVARSDSRAIEGETEPRRSGPLAILDAARHDHRCKQDQRPWNLAGRFSRNAVS